MRGVPLAAGYLAGTLSPQAEAKLGASLLQVLDSTGCRPSALDAARRDALLKRLAQLGDGYRLELRVRKKRITQFLPNSVVALVASRAGS